MSNDSFSETSYTSWFSRLGSAFTGILFGAVLFFASFVLLYWNESRAIDTARSLERTGAATVSVPADKVDPANNGKPVHVTGKALTSDTLTDDLFGVSASALRLVRTVEMYQWKEEEKQERTRNLGGGETTKTTYSYVKEWSASPIDSSRFKSNTTAGQTQHVNPAWPDELRSRTQNAGKVTVGAFTLSPGLLSQVHTTEKISVGSDDLKKVSSAWQKEFQAYDGRFYRGPSPSSPEIGDLRVSFAVVRPMTVSIIAEQSGDSFRPYQPEGVSHRVEVLYEGDRSLKDMIQSEEAGNTRLTWVLRLVGFIVMALGIGLVLNPLKVFADVIPFVGSIVGFGIGIFAFMTAAVLSLLTIAISWIVVRPVLGISLLAGAGVVLVLMFVRGRGKKTPT